ncbi:MAG: FAD-binding protein [Gemmatimonadales bacterium]|nr:MAG: FAD-binding protein [Gemmatimonadales bacterium]
MTRPAAGGDQHPLEPRMAKRLAEVVGSAGVVTEPGRLLAYESDALTRFRRSPRAVILPRTTEEAARVVRLLVEEGIPLTPRGAGTGLSGGGVAVPGGVLVGTSRMDRILTLDPGRRLARVQAGVVNSDLTVAAEPHGLHYAPDPSSQAACTLGGNVGENAGGPHCLKYGVTTRYVTGVTVVTGSGEVVELGGDGRCESLDLVGLFVGSEGRLGLATEIELRLVPRARGVRTLLAVFSSTEVAGAAVSDIIAAGLLPAAMEIMDQGTIQAVEASIFAAGYPTDAGAVLVVEFDGTEAGLDAEAEAAEALCREAGATQLRRARTEAERQALWQGRKKAFGAFGRITPDLIVQDATVPRSALPGVLARITEIGRRHRLRVANVFHAGDGNLHPKILFDRRDPELVERVEAASREMMQACVEAGGTITGEHGVGLDKRDYMHLVHGPQELEVMRAIQGVFDPAGVWNPGKMLPPAPDGADSQDTPGARGKGADGAEAKGEAGGEPDAKVGVEAHGGADENTRWEPSSVQEVSRLLAYTSRTGTPVRIVGRDGDPNSGARLRLVASGLPGEVDHAPEDLTVTVGAGCPIESLQDRLAASGQWLPLDVPCSRGWRVGELVARGEWGPLAPAYGRVRDLLLGAELVAGDGRVLQLGGRVMKNVAGLDLVRAVAGSRGRWGAVTSATFRLMPMPRAHAVLAWEGDRDAMRDLAGRLAVHPVLPASLVRVVAQPRETDSAGDGAGGTSVRDRVLVRLLGSSPTVDAEARELGTDFPGATVWTSQPRGPGFLDDDPVTQAVEGEAGEGQGGKLDHEEGVLLELRCGTMNGATLEGKLARLLPSGRPWIHLPLAGVWRVSLGEREVDAVDPVSLAGLAAELRNQGGDLCALRGRVPGLGRPEGPLDLLERRVCAVFDPAGVLDTAPILRGGAGSDAGPRSSPEAK